MPAFRRLLPCRVGLKSVFNNLLVAGDKSTPPLHLPQAQKLRDKLFGGDDDGPIGHEPLGRYLTIIGQFTQPQELVFVR